MAQKNSQLADAITNLADATLIDLPRLAIARLFNSAGSDHELRKAGWKAYDASVAVTTELTNRLYRSPRVGRVSGRAIDVSLKFQRLADAVSGAFFAALWPMVGLATASEVRRLGDKIDSLREQLQPGAIGFEAGHQSRFDRELPHADTAGQMASLRLPPTIEVVAPEVKRYVSH
jgi:hypothetical protein